MLTGDNNTKICGAAKIECYEKADETFSSDSGLPFHCNCLRACESIDYTGKIIEAVTLIRRNGTDDLR